MVLLIPSRAILFEADNYSQLLTPATAWPNWPPRFLRSKNCSVPQYVQSAYQEKFPAWNAIYAHAQDFSAGDELLLAILKAFIPLPLNKQQAFMCPDEFNMIQCRTLSQHPQYTVQLHSVHATLNC
jgi:hypothetical protein